LSIVISQVRRMNLETDCQLSVPIQEEKDSEKKKGGRTADRKGIGNKGGDIEEKTLRVPHRLDDRSVSITFAASVDAPRKAISIWRKGKKKEPAFYPRSRPPSLQRQILALNEIKK